MRLNLVLGSFVTVWQCLADLVHDELKLAVGGTAAQLAWPHTAFPFQLNLSQLDTAEIFESASVELKRERV